MEVAPWIVHLRMLEKVSRIAQMPISSRALVDSWLNLFDSGSHNEKISVIKWVQTLHGEGYHESFKRILSNTRSGELLDILKVTGPGDSSMYLEFNKFNVGDWKEDADTYLGNSL